MPAICDLVQSLLRDCAKGNPIVQWAWVEHNFSRPEGIGPGKALDSPKLCARFETAHQYSVPPDPNLEPKIPHRFSSRRFDCGLLAEVNAELPAEEISLPYQTSTLWEDRNGTKTQFPTPENMSTNQGIVRAIAYKKEYRESAKKKRLSENEVPTATSNAGHRQDLKIIDRQWMMYLVNKELIWKLLTEAEERLIALASTVHASQQLPKLDFYAMIDSGRFTAFMPDLQYRRKSILLSTRPFFGYQKTFLQGLDDYCHHYEGQDFGPIVEIFRNNREKIEAVEKIQLRRPIQ